MAAWDKEKDRALSERARTGHVIHNAGKYGTFTRKAGLARKSPGHQRKVVVPASPKDDKPAE